MARLSLTTSKHRKKISQIVVTFWNEVMTAITWFFITVCKLISESRMGKPRIQRISPTVDRQKILYKYAYKSDTTCKSHLRMNRRCFTKLCNMLHTLGGLRRSKHMDIDEQVAIFLHIIAHNVKNRVMIGVIEKIRNYRNWTINEDAKLVEALVNMVNMGGFKADNGFKSGYLQHLENALKEKLPSSGILGKPHIESRIKTMKKDWQVVYDMVNGTNTSGFGYDSSTRSVTAEPAVWDSYIQVHKEAGKWRNKIFPHYDDLCIVFGKDRAQGNKAKDFSQIEEDANNEEQSEQTEDGYEEQSTETEESPNVGSKKRKSRVDAVIKGIAMAANVLGEKLKKAANSMNQAILGETEVQKKASMVIPEVSKMKSLSAPDRFKASRKIMRDPETVLSFWNLNGEDREAFVKFMLEE